MNAEQEIEEIRAMYYAAFGDDRKVSLKEMVASLMSEAGSNASHAGFMAAMQQEYDLYLPDGSEVKIKAEYEPDDRSVGIVGGHYFVITKEHEKAVEEMLGKNAELHEAFETIKKAVESVKE